MENNTETNSEVTNKHRKNLNILQLKYQIKMKRSEWKVTFNLKLMQCLKLKQKKVFISDYFQLLFNYHIYFSDIYHHIQLLI